MLSPRPLYSKKYPFGEGFLDCQDTLDQRLQYCGSWNGHPVTRQMLASVCPRASPRPPADFPSLLSAGCGHSQACTLQGISSAACRGPASAFCLNPRQQVQQLGVQRVEARGDQTPTGTIHRPPGGVETAGPGVRQSWVRTTALPLTASELYVTGCLTSLGLELSLPASLY